MIYWGHDFRCAYAFDSVLEQRCVFGNFFSTAIHGRSTIARQLENISDLELLKPRLMSTIIAEERFIRVGVDIHYRGFDSQADSQPP